MKAINWDAVRTVYVTTEMSLPQVSAKFGLKLHSVSERCRKDGWVAARTAFRAQAAAKAVDQAVNVEADRLGKIINAANSMAAVIEAVYKDPDQFHRHLVVNMDVTEEKTFDKVDTKAIRDMTVAIKDMTLVLRNLHNLPTQAEAEAQRIAAERLKLEQRKIAMLENNDEDDDTGVIMMPPVLEKKDGQ